MEKGGCIYFMANVHYTTLYIGVTSDLLARVYEHKEKVDPNSFTAKYNLNKLVYYELFSSIEEAIIREKKLKKWNRLWKDEVVFAMNPQLIDLYPVLLKEWGYQG